MSRRTTPKPGRPRKRAQREAAFAARMRRLGRLRTIVGMLGFIPLTATLACGVTTGALPFCAIPRDWYLLMWAGVFGTFVGLTIRQIRERRRYQRGEDQ